MCWAKSKIPLDVWKSGESNSNLIEMAHADTDREGIGCTLVGGFMKGQFFDMSKNKSILVSLLYLIVLRSPIHIPCFQALEKSGIRPQYKSNYVLERMLKNVKCDRTSNPSQSC